MGKYWDLKPFFQDQSIHCKGYFHWAPSKVSGQTTGPLLSFFFICTLHFGLCISTCPPSMPVTSDHDHSLPLPSMSEEGKECASGKQFDERLKAMRPAQQLSDTQASLSYCIHPWAAISAQLGSEIVVKYIVKRRDGGTPPNGKESAYQPGSTVQLVGLFISDHQRVCHLYSQGVSNKDKLAQTLLKMAKVNIQAVHKTSAPFSTCTLSCYPISKLPFHSCWSLYANPHSISWANVTVTFTLFKTLYAFVCWALNFFKPAINSFRWCNFHNLIPWVARKCVFFFVPLWRFFFPPGTIMSVPFSFAISLIFNTDWLHRDTFITFVV